VSGLRDPMTRTACILTPTEDIIVEETRGMELCFECHHVRNNHANGGGFCWGDVDGTLCGCRQFTPSASSSKPVK